MLDIYCLYCAQSLLNSMTLVRTEHRDVLTGQRIGEVELFQERGYEAIVTLGRMKQYAESQGTKFVITLNQIRSDMMIFASFFIDGNAVCAMHVPDAIERIQRRIYR